MKTKSLYAIIVCAATMLSCSNDPDERSLSGSWHLTNATTPEGTNLNYTTGEVTWRFNENNHTLTVENSVLTLGPENTLAGPATGNYTFSVKQIDGIDYLYVDGDQMGAIANTGVNLVVNTTGNSDVIKVFSR